MWAFFGGHRERLENENRFETPFETALREIWEEIYIKPNRIFHFGRYFSEEADGRYARKDFFIIPVL